MGAFLFVMALSLGNSLLIAQFYVIFYANRATGSQVHRAFPLLGISITAIFIAIQFSLPLSLGLLGALSIVRFRTPIKEPEEIGFIMLVIAAALACATLKLGFLGILLLVALAALLIQRVAARVLHGRTRRRVDRHLPAGGRRCGHNEGCHRPSGVEAGAREGREPVAERRSDGHLIFFSHPVERGVARVAGRVAAALRTLHRRHLSEPHGRTLIGPMPQPGLRLSTVAALVFGLLAVGLAADNLG